MKIYWVLFSGLFLPGCGDIDSNYENDVLTNHWIWPQRSVPSAFVVCKEGKDHGENALAASLAGIVAQKQEEGLVDELIWSYREGDYLEWYDNLIKRTGAREIGVFNVWELLERYKSHIKGYILYSSDKFGNKEKCDISYNIAASYSGVYQAVVVDKKYEEALIKRGFSKMLDARNISRQTCLNDLDNHASREMVVTMNPRFHNNIDLAVAGRAFVTYGLDSVSEAILARNHPGTPVVGWNKGDEFEFTALPSRYGLFNTASDWCSNLLSLSAGASTEILPKAKTLDSDSIDFDEHGVFHSFIMSDGDNMQWAMGNFINNEDFWGSSLHGEFPVGFTSCPVNLGMMAPDVLKALIDSQPVTTTLIEYGGGYYYPDLFGSDVAGISRQKIYREYVRKVNHHMKRSGIKVFGLICKDFDSSESLEMLKVLAEELEELVGIIAVEYAPYHGGGGKVLWVKNRDGIDIPVVSARYSLWAGLEDPNGGEPLKIAANINNLLKQESDDFSWTVVHAWSRYTHPGNKEKRAGAMQGI
jgi:hypothetical protein